MVFLDITIQISANSVAWYGAVIATMAAAVSIYNVWRDRSRVVLSFGKNLRRVEAWDEPLFYVSVVNRGRRPVRVDKAWVKLYGYDGETLIADSLGTRLDRTLDERNPKITFWVKESTLETKRIYCIFASDETGRVYKKYIKNFPTFTRLLWFVGHKKIKK